MNKNYIVAGSILGGTLLVAFIFVLMIFGALNSENALRQQLVGKQKALTVTYDNTWKIIAEKAAVSSKYEQAFKEIYPTLIKGRYEDSKNLLFKFIHASNPTLETRLYEDVMRSIEVQRTNFTNDQKDAIELQSKHNIKLTTYPWAIVYNLLGRQPFDLKLVTSDRTDNAFKTGKDDVIIK